MSGNGNVHAGLCSNPAAWISVEVDYTAHGLRNPCYSDGLETRPTYADCNGNGVPDECEAPPACDVNCDGTVNPFDIQWFLEQLGPEPPPLCSPCAADAIGDGTVNPFDINDFLICLVP